MTLVKEGVEHVLVTGGAGFIGSHVCDALVAAGLRVRSLDDYSNGNRANLSGLTGHPRFEERQGTILRDVDVISAMAGVDAVVHLAALGSVPRSLKDPIATHKVNMEGFLHVLEAARHASVRRVVFASSSSVYGDSAELPKREGRIGLPLSPYAVSKLGNELHARLYNQVHGLATIGLRFFNVFGERQDPNGPYAAAIPRFMHALLSHRSPVIHGDGLQTRDFTHVSNVVQVIRQALATSDERAFGNVFNVAYGDRITLLEVVSALQAALLPVAPETAGLQVVHEAERVGDIRHSLADISLAREVLGYAPAVSLKEGIARAAAWYASNRS